MSEQVSTFRYESDGIQLEKSVKPTSINGVRVMFTVTSSRNHPTEISITDPLPQGSSGISVSDENWVVFDTAIEYRTIIDAGSEIRTKYDVHYADIESDHFHSEPVVETLDLKQNYGRSRSDDTKPARTTDGGLSRHGPRTTEHLEEVLEPAQASSVTSGESGQTSLGATRTETGILVGIPAYNEAATVGSVVAAARNYSDKVLVVDDGSTDETVMVAESAGAEVIQHQSNKGKGAAVRTIFAEARAGQWPHLVILDGDWQHNPREIPQLIHPLTDEETNVVIGSRYLDGQETDTPLYRRFGQRVLDLLTISNSGVSVTDSQSGFRAFDRQAIEEITFTENGFGIESEMLSAVVDAGLDIKEVQISANYDVPSPSTSNSVWHGLSVVDTLLRIIRDRHPLLFFGVPGVILSAVGISYGVWTVELYQSSGTFFVGKALFSTVMFLVGLLSIYSALIMNMISNRLRRFV